jgi:GxxExxY protein
MPLAAPARAPSVRFYPLGPGLLESAYAECLCCELNQSGIALARQVPLPIVYKGIRLDCGYRLDVVVQSEVILEIKSVDQLLPIHDAQLLTYLRLSVSKVRLLMNFNTRCPERRDPSHGFLKYSFSVFSVSLW